MIQRQPPTSDLRISQALDELKNLIRSRYPAASFEVAPAEDDPDLVHLYARVDVEDTWDVAELVMDRMVEMQVDEGLPVYVIPLRTPERIAAIRQAERDRRAAI